MALRYTFGLLLILLTVSVPKNISPPMLSCIYADQTSFKSAPVSAVDALQNKSQLAIFCEVSSCDYPSKGPEIISGLAAGYKSRPSSWSGEKFDRWRVWSESPDICFFDIWGK